MGGVDKIKNLTSSTGKDSDDFKSKMFQMFCKSTIGLTSTTAASSS